MLYLIYVFIFLNDLRGLNVNEFSVFFVVVTPPEKLFGSWFWGICSAGGNLTYQFMLSGWIIIERFIKFITCNFCYLVAQGHC